MSNDSRETINKEVESRASNINREGNIPPLSNYNEQGGTTIQGLLEKLGMNKGRNLKEKQ